MTALFLGVAYLRSMSTYMWLFQDSLDAWSRQNCGLAFVWI